MVQAIELSKTINMRKTNSIWKLHLKIIGGTQKEDTSVKIARTIGIGRKQLYALKVEQDQITNREEVIKIAEDFYRKLYSSNDRQIKYSSTEIEHWTTLHKH